MLSLRVKNFCGVGHSCPVACFETLISKCPADRLQMCGPLYLAPLRKERDWSKTKVWFPRQPVGVNTINQFMKNMTKEDGLDITANNFTNHLVRKTAVRKLKKGGASSREIMAILGQQHWGWGGGGGNRGRLPRAPSVRGPPNSAGLASLRGCFTVFLTEVRLFFCFAYYTADANKLCGYCAVR